MRPQKHSLRWSPKNHDGSLIFWMTDMKQHPILILVLVFGLLSGCASTPEKKLKTEGFTLSYRDKAAAGSPVNKMQLSHPVNLSEERVRTYLKSLAFEELSLFGKKKSVFLPQDLDRMARLLTKAIQRVPDYKIIHYELETPGGTTAGDIFADKKYIHWRFDSIKGMVFSGRSQTGWGNTNWRMVPQSDQKYYAVHKLLGTQAQENWIIADLALSKTQRNPKQRKSRPSGRKTETPPMDKESAPPVNSPDPALEEKLKFLKDLHEKNLIDEKEYDQKRKELLNTYL